MLEFARSYAGKGTAFVCLGLACIIWPAAVAWPFAAVTSAYGVKLLFASARAAAAEEREAVAEAADADAGDEADDQAA